MGKKKHIDGVRKLISSTPAFRARDVEYLVGGRGYALQLLHTMARRGEVHRLVRGWYSASDDPVAAVFALAPAYIGLQDALSLRGIWEQETNVVVVTSGKGEPGARSVFGSRVTVHRIDPRYFFGFDFIPYGRYQVPVSDPEKTMIDLVYFRERPGKEAVVETMKRADRGLLRRYLRRYPPGFVSRFERSVRRWGR